ncbi:MAG: DUF1858 domain-containing protein [archaeon]
MVKDKITKDMTISDILRKYPGTAEVFFEHGLHCLGCAAAHFENLEDAANAHGLDLKKLLEDLNSELSKKV